MLLIVLIMHYVVPLETFDKAIYVIIFTLIINIILTRVVTTKTIQKDSLRFIELSIDLILWVLFLHYTGSIKNPFTFIILPYIAISAVTMSRIKAWIYGMCALAIYTLLWMNYWHDAINHESNSVTSQLLGVWFVFATSIVITIWFNTNLVKIIKKYEKKIENSEQTTVHDNWIVSLGSQAANTAHEISTPLSTLSTLVEELRNSEDDPIQLSRSDLDIIDSQLAVCRSALKQLSRQAQTSYTNSFECQNAPLWMEEQKQRWDIKYPNLTITLKQSKTYLDCYLVTCISLEQAINNLVDNAAIVTENIINITTLCSNYYFEIRIQDDGPGISDEMISNLGRGAPLKSERGLGLGLILAKGNINRLGGTLELQRLKQGGTEARVLLPLCEGFGK
jgi:two-component system sensor histidine kinase RegB